MKNKVAIVGASGEIGKVLTALLKADDKVDHVALYDIANVGTSVDAFYIPTRTTISGHQGPSKDELEKCLKDARFVVLIAGRAWKTGLTREEMFDSNARIIKEVLESVVTVCPAAYICMVTNPVNSLVPLVYEFYKRKTTQVPNVLGVSMLDVVRAKVIVGEEVGRAPEEVDVDVIGGHSDKTMLPVLSSIPGVSLGEERQLALEARIVNCMYEVTEARANLSTASLSMAYTIRLFIDGLIMVLQGKKGSFPLIAYIKNEGPEGAYFARRFELEKDGSVRGLPLPELSEREKKRYDKVITQIAGEIRLAVEWAEKNI